MNKNTKPNYLARHKKVLKFCGLSLSEQNSWWYSLYTLIISCLLACCPVTTMLYMIAIGLRHLDLFLESLAFTVSLLTNCVKLLTVYRVRKQIGRALVVLQGGVFAPNFERGGAEEELLINKCTFYVNFQLTFFYVMTAGNVAVVVTRTLVSRLYHSESQSWSLPYGGFSLFDISSSPNFEMVWLFQFCSVNMNCLITVTTTTFNASVMAYLSYQCKMLQNYIRRLLTNSSKHAVEGDEEAEDPSSVLWPDLQKHLKGAVEYHTAIIDLASQFEDLFNIPALIDFIGQSIIICMALFYCTMFPAPNARSLNQILMACGYITLQFVISYWGHNLIVESEGVSEACYGVNFAGADIRLQKALVVIIQRSQRPIEFTVGKFAPISLKTFQRVLQTAYSYYALLRNFKYD